MVVVRDDVFAQRGIDRSNQRRLANEHAAQTQRAAQPVQSRRVDTQRPMYSNPRPSHRGGGALGPWTLVILLPLVWLAFFERGTRRERG